MSRLTRGPSLLAGRALSGRGPDGRGPAGRGADGRDPVGRDPVGRDPSGRDAAGRVAPARGPEACGRFFGWPDSERRGGSDLFGVVRAGLCESRLLGGLSEPCRWFRDEVRLDPD